MAKKEEIIHAAFKLFSEKGYALSMSDIAKAVKIKTPSLYSHFESKDEIVELTIKKEIEHYFFTLDKLIDSMKDKTCKEKLNGMFLSVLDYFSQSGRLRFWRNIPLLNNDKLRNKCRTIILEKNQYYTYCFMHCFENGIENGEINKTAGEGSVYLYHSMMQGILDVMLLLQSSSFDTREYSIKIWNAFWNGIKAEGIN